MFPLILAGAALGAGAGQLMGGNTQSTLMGAGLGAGIGLGASAFGGAGAGSGGAFESAYASGGATGLNSAVTAASTGNTATLTGASTGLFGMLSQPLIPGMSFTSPLLLGSAGLTLANAYGSKGASFQDPIALSAEGKALEKKSFDVAKNQLEKAKTGNVSDKIFNQISGLKSAEGIRQRQTEGMTNTALATAYNRKGTDRGYGAVGGSLVKAELSDSSERMTGLFAPTSLLNSARREELFNAIKQVQNLSNIENQTAVANYGSKLAQWSSNQMLASEKGAAIGSVAAMIGGSQLNSAYLNQMKIA